MGLSVSSEVFSGIDPKDYNQFLFKIVVVGDYGVGKSCLVRRFASNQFEEIVSTVAVDFAARYLILDKNIIKLQIWDTAGQERFRSIASSYLRGAHGVVLVYDVTKRSSLEKIKDWVKQIENSCGIGDRTNRILVGSKCDLHDKREVTFLEGKELADKLGYLFIETSSSDGRNVEQAFLALTSKIVEEENLKSKLNTFETMKLSGNTTDIKNRASNCC